MFCIQILMSRFHHELKCWILWRFHSEACTSHDGSMVLVFMLTWLGYIDGIHVTINIAAPWILWALIGFWWPHLSIAKWYCNLLQSNVRHGDTMVKQWWYFMGIDPYVDSIYSPFIKPTVVFFGQTVHQQSAIQRGTSQFSRPSFPSCWWAFFRNFHQTVVTPYEAETLRHFLHG